MIWIGFAVLFVLAEAAIFAVIWSRLDVVRRLPEHESYIAGWNACSRIRDRLESQERKEQLLASESAQKCVTGCPIVAIEDSRPDVVNTTSYANSSDTCRD